MALILTNKGKQKRVKELESKFLYYRSLLTAGCLQILQRLDVISHSNLIYSQYYNENYTIFLSIQNKEAKWCEKELENLDDHLLNPKKPNFKEDYKRALDALESFRLKVINLNDTLNEIIRPEEEARGEALVVKEYGAYVKKKYYQSNTNFEIACPAFEKIFVAVEKKFASFDMYIDAAEYELALGILPKIKKVLEELARLIEILPKLCLDAVNNVPGLTERAYQIYENLDAQKLPLLYLNPKKTLRLYKEENNTIIELIKNLKIDEASKRLKILESKIIDFINSLEKEEQAKLFYDENFAKIYDFADLLGKKIINLYNDIPEIRKVYKFDEFHDNIVEELQRKSAKLADVRRNVDVNIFTTSRQPYSLIIEKIRALHETNDEISEFLNSFNAYLKSLKDDCTLGFELVSNEYSVIRKHNVLYEDLGVSNPDMKESFVYLYMTLDNIVELIKSKPIDVILLNKKVNEYKKISSSLFSEVVSLNEKKKQCEKYIETLSSIRSDFEIIDINLNIAEELYSKAQYNESFAVLDKLYKENSNFSKNDLFR